jgi:hypothetical protein
MEGPLTKIENNEIYLQEEFIKKFENFHLLFSIKYDEEFGRRFFAQKFLLENYPIRMIYFGDVFKKKKSCDDIPQIVSENMDTLYPMYTALRKEGFSNKELGLKYY